MAQENREKEYALDLGHRPDDCFKHPQQVVAERCVELLERVTRDWDAASFTYFFFRFMRQFEAKIKETVGWAKVKKELEKKEKEHAPRG